MQAAMVTTNITRIPMVLKKNDMLSGSLTTLHRGKITKYLICDQLANNVCYGTLCTRYPPYWYVTLYGFHVQE
jgi:hypothetical protein